MLTNYHILCCRLSGLEYFLLAVFEEGAQRDCTRWWGLLANIDSFSFETGCLCGLFIVERLAGWVLEWIVIYTFLSRARCCLLRFFVDVWKSFQVVSTECDQHIFLYLSLFKNFGCTNNHIRYNNLKRVGSPFAQHGEQVVEEAKYVWTVVWWMDCSLDGWLADWVTVWIDGCLNV